MDSACIPMWDALGVLVDTAPAPPMGPGPLGPNTVPILDGPRRHYQSGDVIPTNISGYILWGQAPEFPAGYYGEGDGAIGEYHIHFWSTTKYNANRLYRWFLNLISGQRLDLSAHEFVEGAELRKLADVPDEPDASGVVRRHQVHGILTAETIQAA